jgi:hypothetical protein
MMNRSAWQGVVEIACDGRNGDAVIEVVPTPRLKAAVRGPLCALIVLGISACDGELSRKLPPASALQRGPGHAVDCGVGPRLLVGDSATQAVLQNANFDIEAWLDDLEHKGIRAAMVWSFMAVPQTADGKVVDTRYGYVVPDIGPWERSLPDPLANDGRPRWNLERFDDDRYWPRFRLLLKQTQARGMALWITVFDGWAKEVSETPFHPFRQENGGPLRRGEDFVVLDDYSQEIDGPLVAEWPWQRKNQWFQERFADRIAREVSSYDHVILEMFNEGEWYDQEALLKHEQHFLRFFGKRVTAPLAMNSDHASLSEPWNDDSIDIVSWHSRGFDTDVIYRRWIDGYSRSPHKPVVNSETIPPYPRGYGEEVSVDQVRRLVWTTLMAGGHVFVQDDSAFAFDPLATREDGEALRTQLGIAARFFEQIGCDPSRCVPAPATIRGGYGLAVGPCHRVAYHPRGGVLRLDLSGVRQLEGEWLNPRTAERLPLSRVVVPDNGSLRLSSPDDNDWVVRLWCAGDPEQP